MYDVLRNDLFIATPIASIKKMVEFFDANFAVYSSLTRREWTNTLRSRIELWKVILTESIHRLVVRVQFQIPIIPDKKYNSWNW